MSNILRKFKKGHNVIELFKQTFLVWRLYFLVSV